MKTLKLFLIATILTVGSMTVANAQTRFHVSVNTPGLHVSAGNAHRYYHRGYYAPVYERTYYRPYGYYHRAYYRPYYRPYYHRTVVVHRVYRRW